MQAGSGYQAQKPVLALHHAPALIPRDARPHLSPAHVHPSEGAPQAQAHHGHPGRDLLPEPTPAHSHPCNPDAAARFWPAESLHASPRCRPSESRLSSPAGGGCLRMQGLLHNTQTLARGGAPAPWAHTPQSWGSQQDAGFCLGGPGGGSPTWWVKELSCPELATSRAPPAHPGVT